MMMNKEEVTITFMLQSVGSSMTLENIQNAKRWKRHIKVPEIL